MEEGLRTREADLQARQPSYRTPAGVVVKMEEGAFFFLTKKKTSRESKKKIKQERA